MRKIKLNPNSWLFKLWRYFYTDGVWDKKFNIQSLEKDGCKVGWQIILLPLVIILSWPSTLLTRFTGRSAETGLRIAIGAIFQILGQLLSFILMVSSGIDFLTGTFILDFYILSIPGMVLLFLTLMVVTFLILGLNLLGQKMRKRERKEDPKRRRFISEWIKAKKEKSCPIIKWEE